MSSSMWRPLGSSSSWSKRTNPPGTSSVRPGCGSHSPVPVLPLTSAAVALECLSVQLDFFSRWWLLLIGTALITNFGGEGLDFAVDIDASVRAID